MSSLLTCSLSHCRYVSRMRPARSPGSQGEVSRCVNSCRYDLSVCGDLFKFVLIHLSIGI